MHTEYSQIFIIFLFVLTVPVCYDVIITGEQKHLFSRHRRSEVSFAPIWKHALYTCCVFRVSSSVPVCCSLLREFAATSRPFPGSLRSARLWREKEPPLETIPSMKTSWRSGAAPPGRDGLHQVFVSTSR